MAFSRSGPEARGEAESKWSDIIKNSERIPNKTFKIYLPKTVKEDLNKDGQVRRVTFGQKDPKARSSTIILVGETGSGKSALINMMVNYMLGVKWGDKVRFQIIRDEGDRPQTEFQTTAITVYEILGLEGLSVPFSLTVIDTPGYGDTRGPEQDKKIAQNLYMLLKSVSGVQQINAVCVVVKSSVSPRQKYIFDTILSLLGKNMEKNILTLITFSNWLKPINTLEAVKISGVPFRQDENEQPVYFLFDNIPYQKPEKSFEKILKSHWDNGMKSFAEFFEALDGMAAQSLKMTETTLKERKKLEMNFQSLEGKIEDAQLKHAALKEQKKILAELKEDMKKTSNFEYKYTTVVMEERESSQEATRCPECKVNCHYPGCWWVVNLSWCSVMSDGKCTVCPKKCSYTVHKKENKIYEAVEKEMTGINVDLRKTTKGKITAAEEMVSSLEQEVKAAEAAKTCLIEQCYNSVLELEKHALKFHSENTRKTIFCLIDCLKVNNDTVKEKELERMLENTV